MHLKNELKLSKVKAYMAGYVQCKIKTKPITIQGGHVFFMVEDFTGIIFPAAIYEPTCLTNIASQLEIGDLVKIGCGVRKATSRHVKTLNVEYLSILNLVQTYDIFNPLCKKCKKRMKSEGKNKGFQCNKCGYKDSNAEKVHVARNRKLEIGLYLPAPKSHRHLTKPIHRYGIEKRSLGFNFESKLFVKWFSFDTQ
jgi:tRNA(Ile2)-agmatinylcytidine synthase